MPRAGWCQPRREANPELGRRQEVAPALTGLPGPAGGHVFGAVTRQWLGQLHQKPGHLTTGGGRTLPLAQRLRWGLGAVPHFVKHH